MTMLMLSKNLSKGFPSSPHWAMAIPVTTAKTTKPKMLVELEGKRIYRRGKLKASHGGAGLDRWGIADIYNGEDDDFLQTPLDLLQEI